MPLPLIIPIAMGVAALVGVGKGVKAVMDNNEAGDLNDSAQDKVKRCERELEKARQHCQQSLTTLGEKKAHALENNIQNFLETFRQIKNVDFVHDGDLGNLHLRDFDMETLDEMTEAVNFIISSGLGVGGGAVGGAAAAFGAYSGTMALAAASTGTAISSLSGAAATNATLAWLGGGTLASGGMGVAGGTLALGAIAAGPALLIAGWYMGSKAEANLDNARSNMAQAEKFEADANAAIALTNGIASAAQQVHEVLSVVCKTSRRQLSKLKTAMETQGLDYAQYNLEAKELVMRNVKLAQLIKAVVDTPILDEEGNLLGDAEANIHTLREEINAVG